MLEQIRTKSYNLRPVRKNSFRELTKFEEVTLTAYLANEIQKTRVNMQNQEDNSPWDSDND